MLGLSSECFSFCMRKLAKKSRLGWVSGFAALISVSTQAAYQCGVTGETCSYQLNSTGIYWLLACRPIYSCFWVADPPPPPPPTPAPPPPSPPPPPPVAKTPEQIEREQHVKFCKEFPAEIDLAVQRCQNAAQGYHSYYVSNKCSSGDATWNFTFTAARAVTVNITRNVSSADCRANAQAELTYTQSSCSLSGNEYKNVLKQQCSDVP